MTLTSAALIIDQAGNRQYDIERVFDMKKWFLNQRISNKLIIGFLIVAFIALVVGIIGIINLNSIKNSDTILYEKNTLGLKYSGSAAVNFQQLRYNMLKITTLTDENERANIKTQNDSIILTIKDLLANCDTTMVSAETKAFLKEIEKNFSDYESNINLYYDTIKTGNITEADNIVYKTLAPLGTELRDQYLALFDKVSVEADNRAVENTSISQNAVIMMVVVIVVGILLSIIFGIYIAGIIGKPLKMMSEGAEKLAQGDVDIELDIKARKDEIGKLKEAFFKVVDGRKKQVGEVRRMAGGDLTVSIQANSDKDVLNQSLSHLVDSLNELVVSIVNSAEQVASGANLVSNSSIALSQGATEQASSVEQLTASLEEIASQTTLNAQNAQTVNSSAKDVRDNAEAGNKRMKEMLNAMDDINKSSGSINKIIKVIDDIAFQTNILALNAAVEAARAGQHGKGFAVVAEEVRTLAARSAQAAKETTDLIEGSIRKVETGTKIANETAEALSKIVIEAAKAADLIESIAIASNEQAAAIEQVNQGIIQVSNVVQSNAATSEESAAASEELSGQAEQLREIVSTFRVKGYENQQTLKIESTRSQAPKKVGSGVGKTAALGAPKASISTGDGGFGKY